MRQPHNHVLLPVQLLREFVLQNRRDELNSLLVDELRGQQQLVVVHQLLFVVQEEVHAGDALLIGEECVGDVEADYLALLLPRAEVEVEGRKLLETAAFYRLPVDFQGVFFSVERVRHGGEVYVELDDLLFYPLGGVLGEEAVVYFGEPGVEFGKGGVHFVELVQRVFVFTLEAVLLVQLGDQLFKVLESVSLYDKGVQSSLFAEKFVQLLAFSRRCTRRH